MKKAVVGLVITGMVLGVLALTLLAAEEGMPKGAKTAAKGEQVTLTGRLSCTFCGLAHPEKPCPKDCCVNCMKAGDPPLLIDAGGNLYILLTGEHEVPLMTPARMELAGQTVAVKGLLVKGKGVQAVYVDSMDKAPEAKAQ